MNGASLLVVVAITSVAASLIGVRTALLAPGQWRVATRHALEILGLGFAFFVLNVAVLAGGAIAVRSLSGSFVSVYVANDLALVALSMFQGVLFGHWRQQSVGAHEVKPRTASIAPS